MEMEYRMEVNDSRIWEHRTDKPHKCNAIDCESEASYKALCNVTIKNPKGGTWANNILSLAPFAERRMVLSGTPMPNNFKDLWNQIQFLWPGNNPLGTRSQYEYNLKS